MRVAAEERNALVFHCLKNLVTREVDTLRFTTALFGLAPPPYLLAGVIEHNLNDWSEKCPEIVSDDIHGDICGCRIRIPQVAF